MTAGGDSGKPTGAKGSKPGPVELAAMDRQLLSFFRKNGVDPDIVDALQAELERQARRAHRFEVADWNLAEVARLSRKGMKSADIARQLGLSPSYVGRLRKQAEAAPRRKGKRG